MARSIQCTMLQRTNSHYIAPEISLAVLEYSEISVKDAVIASSGRKAVRGTVSKENSQRMSILWEVRNVPVDPGESRRYAPMLQVRLTIQKKDGKASMTVTDMIYDQFSYKASGVCRFDG